MRKIRCRLCGFICVSIALSATGCGVKPVPTKGVVTFNGKPLARATVNYAPDEPSGRNATGFTDERGVFELTTFTLKDGALPGSYKVTVHPSATLEGAPIGKGPGDAQQANASATMNVIIPEIYTRPDQTPLQRRIPEDGDAKIELTGPP